MNTLSIFYIVKNEENYIKYSLNSIKDVANEIILVDTGSIDRTIEVAKAYNCRIFKYKWDNDFSAARNFALKKCRKNFVLYLNADEILEDNSKKIIKEIIKENKYIAYFTKIKDVFDKWPSKNCIENNYSKKNQLRLFYNDNKISFNGEINESVERSIFRLKYFTLINSDICIYHHLFRGKNNKMSQNYIEDKVQKEINNEKNISSQINDEKNISYQIDDEKNKCAIIIICHNLFNITKECINSILKETYYPYNLYIVDNGSTDENFKSYLESLIDNNIHITFLNKNESIAKARNIGMKNALELDENQYICLLDNDTKVSEKWLYKLIKGLNSNNISLIGPVTNSCTGAQNKVHISWLGKYNSKQIEERVFNEFNKKTIQETKYLSGFCHLFNKEILNKIGFLDENLGQIGFEEKDFCKRLINSNFKIGLHNKVFVYHKGRATTIHNKLPYKELLKESSKKYNDKWNNNNNNEFKKNKVKNKSNERMTSIIVLTYNNLEINKRFFDALYKFTENFECIVVDNNSTDGTIEYLEELDWITLIKNEKNLGVIKARNIGLQYAKYNYLICLDNDQIVKKNWLTYLYNEMDKGYDFVGVEAWEVNKKYLPIKRHMRKRKEIKIDYVGAGGCLMKRSVLEEIGIYDERFGMAYFEDVDLCIRAKKAGYKIGWCDINIINHLEHSTLIKGQKDFNYSDELSKSHEKFIEKINKKSKVSEKELPIIKKTTFCMCLKNRPKNALKSIESLVNERSFKYFNFIIVEDESENMLDLSDFKYSHLINHYKVNTGITWTRGGLLNYGVKRSTTKLVSFWDADFEFSENFCEKFNDLLKKINFDKHFLQVQVTENADHYKKGSFFPKGTLWGGLYTYDKNKLLKINGFDENFVMWGYEDFDLNNRLKRHFKIDAYKFSVKNFIFHMSHNDQIRNYHKKGVFYNKKLEEYNTKKNINIVNRNKEWGEFKKMNKTIIVMGNGPSLKEIDFESIRNHDTFGMNLAYRYWRKNEWWPTYYGCFDYVVTDNHKEELKEIIENPDIPIKKYFLLRNISNSNKLKVLKLNSNKIGDFSTKFDDFRYGGNTGVNCCQASICMGYNKIILVGVDCNYKQIVDGAKKYQDGKTERLKMEKTPEKNPNYFFDDYNQKGDKYNIPNAHVFMEPAWKAFAEFAKNISVDVVNCSENSKLNCFRRSKLEKEL